MHLDYGGNAGQSPIRLNPVRVLKGISYNDHPVGGRIFDQLLEPGIRATARSVWKPLSDQMKLQARLNGSAGFI